MGQYLLRLVIAAILGFIMGLTSNIEDNSQSSRVFSIICVGAALISITSVGLYQSMNIPWVGDPGRMPAQVISALGFLGTGMIWVTQDDKVQGITSAASLWLTAILGMLIGAGLNNASIIGTIFFILIYKLSPLIPIRSRIKK
jgi:putative Mg2+ transporter-C (MgtC) family protein